MYVCHDCGTEVIEDDMKYWIWFCPKCHTWVDNPLYREDGKMDYEKAWNTMKKTMIGLALDKDSTDQEKVYANTTIMQMAQLEVEE